MTWPYYCRKKYQKISIFVTRSSSLIDWKQMTLCRVIDLDFNYNVPIKFALINVEEIWTETNCCSYISDRKWLIPCQKICTGLTFIHKKYATILMLHCAIIYENEKYHENIYTTKTYDRSVYSWYITAITLIIYYFFLIPLCVHEYFNKYWLKESVYFLLQHLKIGSSGLCFHIPIKF